MGYNPKSYVSTDQKKKRLGVSHKPECTHYLQLASIYVGYRGFSVERCISLVLASEKFKREAISLHHHLTQLAFYLGINFIGLNWLEMAPLLNKYYIKRGHFKNATLILKILLAS